MTIPKQTSQWDERRNSSRVFLVSPDALGNARRAISAYRRDYPEHYDWIIDGHPTLTEAEHVERFGEPYKSHRAKR